MSERTYYVGNAIILVLAIGIITSIVSFALGQSISSTSDFRIVAQKLEDGRIEFGLEQDGERILPRSRYFPADARVGRWLRSSVIGVEVLDDESPVEQPTQSDSSSGSSGTRSHLDAVEYGEFDAGVTEDGVFWAHTDAGVHGVRTAVTIDGYTSNHTFDVSRLYFYCDHNSGSLWASVDAGWRSSVDLEWHPAWLDDDGTPLAYFGVQGTSDWYTYGLFVVSDGYSVQTSNERFWSHAVSEKWVRIELPRHSGSITATFDVEGLAWTPVYGLMQDCGNVP